MGNLYRGKRINAVTKTGERLPGKVVHGYDGGVYLVRLEQGGEYRLHSTLLEEVQK